VTLHFLDYVLLLHLPLKPTQGVFQRFAFLQSDFCQRNYTPKPVLWDSSVIARWAHKVKHYMELLIHPSAIGTDSESETQSKLQLTRCIRVRCLHEIRRHLIICRKVIDSNVLSPKLEACRIVHEAVIRELESAIKAVE